jgi:hypothetical protein
MTCTSVDLSDRIGYGLNDSPVGLASWIIEKFHGWSGKPENIDDHYTKDVLITNIMIYWITQTINTSIRTYAEEAKVAWTVGLKSEMKVEEKAVILPRWMCLIYMQKNLEISFIADPEWSPILN